MTFVFLDCEASSLDPVGSYPIEVAWGSSGAAIESYLIDPNSYPHGWEDWDPIAQAVHGLSRKYLRQYGRSVLTVAAAVCKALEGRTVYSDAPDYDSFWLERLQNAAGYDSAACSVRFEHVDQLLREILPERYWELHPAGKHSERPIDALRAQVRTDLAQAGMPPHRAAHDVAYLCEVYRRALEAGG